MTTFRIIPFLVKLIHHFGVKFGSCGSSIWFCHTLRVAFTLWLTFYLSFATLAQRIIYKLLHFSGILKQLEK